ncbi:MAG: tRNA (adenosine(37)-N6)-threonylcarbamoyltransferase complex transferase subunit TsaD, partial [Rhodothermia bacterium]|nr:tRNA (adenosine(37)-N6)-threonylcarbamoyltransferase complex transferase subunit TsaD [Rhodothermia bacterium]
VEKIRIQEVALTGGVSANSGLRRAANQYCREKGLNLYVPKPAYCMDNAAMIATAAHYKLASGITSPLTLTADPAATLA